MPNLCFLMVKTSVFCFAAVSKLDACVVAAKQRYNIWDWEKDVASKRKVTLSLPPVKIQDLTRTDLQIVAASCCGALQKLFI